MNQDALNILVPAIVGAFATVITAFLSFRVQRAQIQSQVTSNSKAAAEEAEKQTWERITSLMNIQKEAMLKQTEEMASVKAQLENERSERHTLFQELQKAKEDLIKMSLELTESYAEINELREVLVIVRKESEANHAQVEQLRGRIAELEAENRILKSHPTSPSKGM